jgi:hypothetical protein
MCKHDPQCIWFTYFSSSKMCIQYTSCATIDETCTECISGEFSCVAESTVPKGNLYFSIFKVVTFLLQTSILDTYSLMHHFRSYQYNTFI